jgi:hypothetical protein
LGLRAALDLLGGPLRVLGHQRITAVPGLVEGGEIFVSPGISEGHADIAAQSAKFGPEDGCASKPGLEGGLVELEEFAQW